VELREIGIDGVNWIQLVHNRDQWQTRVPYGGRGISWSIERPSATLGLYILSSL